MPQIQTLPVRSDTDDSPASRRGLRRWRVGAALVGIACADVSLAATKPGARSDGGGAIALRGMPLLFVDDNGIAAMSGVVRTFHPAKTRATPVLRSDRPWEGDRVYTYGSVHYDTASRLFRLWYMSRNQRPGPNPAGQLRAGGMDVVLLATSRDGVEWDKPALGVIESGGSRANNIVADFHSPAVVVDQFERDPAKRYKLLGYSRGGYFGSYSADGVHWVPYERNPVFSGSDTMSMTQDPRTGEFMAFFKKPSAEVPGRVVWLTRSRDFQTWSEPRLVFYPDAEDNRWSKSPDQRMEVYNMAVLPHAAGFIGLPTMFRVMTRAAKDVKLPAAQSPHDGPIDVQMVTSADGETWQRTWPRLNMIPRGAPGSFDGGAILGVTSNCVDSGDETWMYYTAINTGHGAPIPPKQLTIGRAEWRRHGFASLDAGPNGGRVETKPLAIQGGTLIVNTDASRGRMRVALHEADGKPIPGFTFEENEPLQTNATRAVVRWKQRGPVPSDRAVRVVLEMTNVRLYSLGSGTIADH